MASYIPASYAGRDFATRPAAHDQLWSNDDCLSSHFITDGRKSIKTLRDEMATERPAQGSKPAKPAMSQVEIDARIKQIKAARKDKEKQRKANKAARAAAGQGGVAGMSHELLHAERRLRQAMVNQTTRIFNEAKQGGDQSTKDSAEIAMLEAKRNLAQLAGAGNAMGKKNKIHVKIPSKDDQDKLRDIVSEHAKNVRVALETASTHLEYTANLHAEFVRFAKAKLNFYEGLPDSPAKLRKVALLQENYDRIAAKPVDGTRWEPIEVFTEFKRIMMDYRQEVDQIRLMMPYTPKGRREKRKELLKERTEAISALLVKNNIPTKARPKRNVRAQGIVGG